MLVYGQIEKVEESLQSFLMQDYPGEKELVILNDREGQTITFRHPQVRVLNASARIESLERKHSYAIGFCTGDLIMPWDSDDVFLPWAMRGRVASVRNEMAMHSLAWIPKDGKLELCDGLFHCNSIYSKDALFRAGGYYPSSPDDSFDWRVMRGMMECGCKLNKTATPDYIYRITDGGVHVSKLQLREEGLNERVDKALGDETEGDVTLFPKWSVDWISLVESAAKSKPTPKRIWDIDTTIQNPNEEPEAADGE